MVVEDPLLEQGGAQFITVELRVTPAGGISTDIHHGANTGFVQQVHQHALGAVGVTHRENTLGTVLVGPVRLHGNSRALSTQDYTRSGLKTPSEPGQEG